ncbi:TMV resistance protein N [Spatholobus suberectus]|nr:TMV resistance protein N [Spatholobus suberectus]
MLLHIRRIHVEKALALTSQSPFIIMDPSDVRHQKGSYGEALARHEERFNANKERFNHHMEKLEKWKMALHQVTNLSDYHFKRGLPHLTNLLLHNFCLFKFRLSNESMLKFKEKINAC